MSGVVSFNVFRVAADLLHLAAMLIMLYRIKTLKTCAGEFFAFEREKKQNIGFCDDVEMEI